MDVFISYSHKDRKWKDYVVSLMQVMQQAGRFNYVAWHDKKIDLGKNWEKEIDAALDQAKVALLLISPDFLQSKFILEHEVPKLTRRSNDGELVMVPLIVRPCPWEAFDWLKPIQGYLEDDVILSGCSDHEIELTLTKLVREVDRLIGDVKSASEAEGEAVDISIGTPKSEGYDTPQREVTLKDDDGFLTNAGVTDLIENSPHTPSGERVIGLIRIFETRSQRTWFAVTSSRFFCVLDDDKTVAAGRRIQWTLPLRDAEPIKVRERKSKSTGLVDVGRRHNWLYSQRVHSDPSLLRASIEEMIETGKRS